MITYDPVFVFRRFRAGSSGSDRLKFSAIVDVILKISSSHGMLVKQFKWTDNAPVRGMRNLVLEIMFTFLVCI